MRILPLKRVVRMTAGQSPSSEDVEPFEGDGLPFLQGNAEFGPMTPSPVHRCDNATRTCQSGDVLVSIRAPVGALNLANRSYGIGRGLCAIRGVGLDQQFLWWLMHSKVSELLALSVGSTYDAVTAEDIGSLRVEVPDFARQRAIADYLDRETARIDGLIEKKQQMLALLEEKFLETVRNQVTGGMSFDDPLDIRSDERLRTGWTRVKLAQDLRFGSGTTPTAGEERYYTGAIPWIVTGDLGDGLLETVPGSVTPEALVEFSALRVHPADALIVAMYGATVGRLAITALPAAVNQACCVMHSGVRLRTWFVFYYLLSHRQVLMERAVGAGQPNISQEILRSLRLVAPDLAAQDRIVSVLDGSRSHVDQLSSRVRDQLDLLTEHRQALITAAVTGELAIPEVAA